MDLINWAMRTVKLLALILFFMFKLKKRFNKMKTNWNETPIKEKMQIVNGTALVFAAIVLYFVAFIVTLTIGFEVISAGATLLASGLAFFGLNSFVKNQMIDFETKVNKRLKEIDDIEQQRKYEP